MINHGSHVPRHVTLFTKVLHVDECSPTIHLPLEFKKRRIQNESPWILVSSQVPDKQSIEAVKCFSGESVTENRTLCDAKRAWNW